MSISETKKLTNENIITIPHGSIRGFTASLSCVVWKEGLWLSGKPTAMIPSQHAACRTVAINAHTLWPSACAWLIKLDYKPRAGRGKWGPALCFHFSSRTAAHGKNKLTNLPTLSLNMLYNNAYVWCRMLPAGCFDSLCHVCDVGAMPAYCIKRSALWCSLPARVRWPRAMYVYM